MVKLKSKLINALGRSCACSAGMHAKSRVPAKRYKKLLVEIYPKSPQEKPNEGKIKKLAEYAAKNPDRLPKIANALEQQGFKELRSERYGFVVVVMHAYSKLLSSCQDQMPLFAMSVVSMIRQALDHRNEGMRVLACDTFVDFMQNMKDSAYIHTCDLLMPKVIALAREAGEKGKPRRLRAAALNATGAMIDYMKRSQYTSTCFDEMVVVILDNYERTFTDPEDEDVFHKTGPVDKAVANVKGLLTKLQDKKHGQPYHSDSHDPDEVAHKCVKSLARFANEVAMARRTLDPMLGYFDNGKHWLQEHGLAWEVLRTMEKVMEKMTSDARGSELLFAVLIHHLDSPGMAKRPELRQAVVTVIMRLVRKSKAKPGVFQVGMIRDVSKHLERSLEATGQQLADGDERAEAEAREKEANLQRAIRECLYELSREVGDAGPVLDMMAAVLEKLSPQPAVARSTLQAMLILTRVVADLSDENRAKDTFPESLILQLLQVFTFHDPEVRALGHSILASLLPPLPGLRQDVQRSASIMAQAVQRLDKLVHKDKKKRAKGEEQKKREGGSRDERRRSSEEMVEEERQEERSEDDRGDDDGAEKGERVGEMKSGESEREKAREREREEKERERGKERVGEEKQKEKGKGKEREEEREKGKEGEAAIGPIDEEREAAGSSSESPRAGGGPEHVKSIRYKLMQQMSFFARAGLGSDSHHHERSKELEPPPRKRRPSSTLKDSDLPSVRFSGHQACLLLSSLWLQGNMKDNTPPTFEAMGSTYGLVVYFSRAKTNSHFTMERALQLALSLRHLSLHPAEGGVGLVRSRSLFTLSTSMLLLASKAYSLPIYSIVAAPYERIARERCPWLDIADFLVLATSPPPRRDLSVTSAASLEVAVSEPAGYCSPSDVEAAAKVWPPPAEAFQPNEGAAAVAAAVADTADVLEASDHALSVSLLEPFIPDEHFALRPRLFDASIAPLSPLHTPNPSFIGKPPMVLSGSRDDLTEPFMHSLSVPKLSMHDEELATVDELLQRVDQGLPISSPKDVRGGRGSAQAFSQQPPQFEALVATLRVRLQIVRDGGDIPELMSNGHSLAINGHVDDVGEIDGGDGLKPANGLPVCKPRSYLEVTGSSSGGGEETAKPEDISLEHHQDSSLGLRQGGMDGSRLVPSFEPWDCIDLPPTTPYDNFLQAAKAGV